MYDEKFRGFWPAIIIVSLVVGAFSGAFGSFFLKPYLEKTNWGKDFLNSNIVQQMAGQKEVIEVTEDSATIDVVKKVSPAVVSVVVTKELQNFYNLTGPDIFDFWNLGQTLPQGGTKEKKEVGGGTGFVIDESGLILTNKHVVSDEQAEYSVVFNDGKKYEAGVLARDTVNDIAVLKIKANNLAVVELGDSDKLQIGQTVIAIGNALGEYRNTVTRGVVSGVNRSIVAGDNYGASELLENVIQTDAAISPGNSGGPLLNLGGQVIGINSAINLQGQSLGFAIPVNQAKTVIDSVKKYGKIVRPWLGVRYVQINVEIAKANKLNYEYGALIIRGEGKEDLAVVPASPADKAGLAENDIILEVNGKKLAEENSLVQEIAKYKPGDEITLKVSHEGNEKMIKVKLEERKE
ncbi:MAG: trypsin-like peptidase domain-containing protein [Patescibacteria group bacterium]